MSRRCVVLAGLIAIGCAGDRPQPVAATVDGHRVQLSYAYAVFSGGRSFRLHLDAIEHDCEWARSGGVGTLADDSAHVDFDLAPVTRSEGTRWYTIGGSFVGGRRTGIDVGHLAFARYPAEVEGAECDRTVTLHVHDDEITLDGTFHPICCTPGRAVGPDAPIPPTDAPMTVEVGDRRYPMTRAWLRRGAQGGEHVRISRALAVCSDITIHEDLYVDIDASGAIAEPVTLSIGGLVVDDLTVFASSAPFEVRIENAPQERLRVDASVTMYADFVGREGPLPVRVNGWVPLTRCPPRR